VCHIKKQNLSKLGVTAQVKNKRKKKTALENRAGKGVRNSVGKECRKMLLEIVFQNSIGKQWWKTALENGIGKQCWKKWCWKMALENGAGKRGWKMAFEKQHWKQRHWKMVLEIGIGKQRWKMLWKTALENGIGK
jgi:hypothetical protein